MLQVFYFPLIPSPDGDPIFQGKFVMKLNLKRETLHGLSSHALSAIHGGTDISWSPDPDGDPAVPISIANTAIMLTPGLTCPADFTFTSGAILGTTGRPW